MEEVIIGEGKKEEVGGMLIHPFSGDVEGTESPVTMHIIGSLGARYIGGVVGEMSPYVTMYFPLMMVEMPQQSGMNLGFRPMFMSLGLMDFITIKHDFIYTLKSEYSRDKQLVKAYENQIMTARAQEIGIVPPTNEEVMKINRR